MSKTQHLFTKQHHYTTLVSVLILGIVTIVGCSGGGGDSNNGNVTPDGPSEPSLLPLYDLAIAGVGNGITAVVDDSGTNHIIRINPTLTQGAGLAATLNCDVTTENCQIGSIKADSRIEIYDDDDSMFGDFTIQVMETLALLGSEKPTAGSLQITSGVDTITLNIKACNTDPGVEIQLNDNAPVCYPWPDFDNLDENPAASPAEQIAVFALDMIDFVFYQADFANNSFDMIGDSIKDAGGSVDLMCAAFTSRGYTPSGITDKGLFSFSWVDDNPNSMVGSGDSFWLNFNDCWLGDIDDINIHNGAIDLNAYTMEINSENKITRFGFEGTTAGKTGGVFYDGFVMIEAYADTDSVFLSGTTISLKGGFTIVYSEPVQ